MRIFVPLIWILAGTGFEEFAVEPLSEPPPKEVRESLRAELSPTGSRIVRAGRPFADFWFRKSLPTGTPLQGLGIQYGSLRPGGLIGVARFAGGSSDFKGQKFGAGVYTLRYAIQPEDGDHQGVSESRDFLLLSSASEDSSPEAMEPKDLHKLSAKVNGKKHPAVLYLVGAQGGPAPRITRDDVAQRVVFETEAPGAGGKPFRLALVVVGKAPE